VRSAGTSAFQRGIRPDPRVQQLAAEAGVPLGRIRSRRLTPKMVRRSDYVLVMEGRQLEEVGRLCAGCPGNVQLLGVFLPVREGGVNVSDIPDPYYGDLQGFREVHELIDSAVSGLAERIDSQLASHSRQ
jgi:protein-tyrosine phosphatase